MWTRHQQQQQRGAQFPKRIGKASEPGAGDTGAAPEEATRDRAAQEHDRAGEGAARPGGYPASPIENTSGDPSTGLRTGPAPTAPEPGAEWDRVVQSERRRRPWDDEPLPEGK